MRNNRLTRSVAAGLLSCMVFSETPLAAAAGQMWIPNAVEAAQENVLVYEAKNQSISGVVDLTEDVAGEQLMNLDEGTIIVQYTSASTNSVQSLFSISNASNNNNNRHFHVYVMPSGVLGAEIRNNPENGVAGVSTDFNYNTLKVNNAVKASDANGPVKNTVAFKADKEAGEYKLFANGEEVGSFDANALGGYKFVNDISGINKVSMGGTVRSGSPAYGFGGTIHNIEIYSEALSDMELIQATSETAMFEQEPIRLFNSDDPIDCGYYRIPSLLTLGDGTVVASIDARYGGTHDSPNNIDNAFRYSMDGGLTWSDTTLPFHLKDYTDRNVTLPVGAGFRLNPSSSVIDPVMVTDDETGRLFLMVDAFMAGQGSPQASQTVTYQIINGKKYQKLKKKGESGYQYTIRENGIIYNSANQPTEYSVNGEFEILQNGKMLTVKQRDFAYNAAENKFDIFATDNDVNMNILYEDALFNPVGTSYIYMKYSDDGGKTWSDTQNITSMVNDGSSRFMIVGPGRGLQLKNGEHQGRLIVPVYTPSEAGIIYSDDHGDTWTYAVGANVASAAMSETQIVEMPDGQLKVFARSNASKVAMATSLDGGQTWSPAVHVNELPQPGYGSQLSVINYDGFIDGKPAIILSTPVGGGRSDGRLKVGLIEDTGRTGTEKYNINWTYDYRIDGTAGYGYSCLTQLPNGNISVLYEKYDSYAGSQLQSRDVTIYEEHSIDRIRGGNTVDIETEVIGEGIATQRNNVAKGASVTLEAKAAAGNFFVGWAGENGTMLSTDTSYTFQANASGVYRAVFKAEDAAYPQIPAKVKVEITAGEGGRASKTVVIDSGKEMTVTASPNTYYEFVNWTDASGNEVSRAQAYKFSPAADQQLTANFQLEKYQVAVQSAGNGTVNGSAEVTARGKTIVEATPNEGYEFLNWTDAKGNAVSRSNPYMFTVLKDTDLTANFRTLRKPVEVTVEALAGGTAEGSCTVKEEDQVIITAIPDEGYDFVGWYIGTGLVSEDAVYTTPPLTEDVTYTAKFKLATYKNIRIASALAESQQPDSPASNAIDGNVDTLWHSNYQNDAQKPVIADDIRNRITFDLGADYKVGKFEYVPRLTGSGNGIITGYQLYYSTSVSGDDFEEIPEGSGTWPNNRETKVVTFEPVIARRIQLKATASAGDTVNAFISAAEIRVFEFLKQENPEPECTCQISGLKLEGTQIIIEEGQESSSTILEASATKIGDCQMEGHENSNILYSYEIVQDEAGSGQIQGNTLTVIKAGTIVVQVTAVIPAASVQETATGEFTVIKHEKPAPQEYTASFEAGEGASGTAPEDIVAIEGSEITLPENPYIREGYEFTGWSDGELAYQPGAAYIMPAASVVFQAIWKKIEEPTPNIYEVTLHAQGGSVIPGSITVTEGQPYGTMPVPSRQGYTFLGWFTAPEGGVQIQAHTICQLSSNAVLYARWKAAVPEVTKPAAPKDVKASGNKTTQLKLSWKKVSGATGYIIERAVGTKGKWESVGTTAGNSLTNKKLKYGTIYKYRVKAYIQNGTVRKESDYSKALTTATAPKKPALKGKRSGTNRAKLTWNNKTKADGFQIYVKVGNGKYKKPIVKSGKAVSHIQKSLKKNKTYSFKIRGFKKAGGNKIYSAYSKVIRLKIK